MAKYYLSGPARFANWALALLLGVSAVGTLLLSLASASFGVALFLFNSLLLLGVLLRWPAAYLGVGVITFFGLAAAMRNENFLVAGFDAALLVAALYRRGQLVVRPIGGSGSDTSPENAA